MKTIRGIQISYDIRPIDSADEPVLQIPLAVAVENGIIQVAYSRSPAQRCTTLGIEAASFSMNKQRENLPGHVPGVFSAAALILMDQIGVHMGYTDPGMEQGATGFRL